MKRLSNFNPELVTKNIFRDTHHSIINFGRCFIWAYSTYLIFANVRLCSTDCHAFILYKGKFYDSDHLQGLSDWKKLKACSFSDFDTFHVNTVHSFKEWWGIQPQRFNTSWAKIEAKAINVLRKFSHEKPSKVLKLSR